MPTFELMGTVVRTALNDEFLARAKSLAKLPEVFRSSQVTLLLAEALATGYRLEAEIFGAAYDDTAGREYWKAQLSEPILVYKLAHVLSVHAAENVDVQESAKIATILTFRDAAEGGEDWFIGDTNPLLRMESGQTDFASLGRIKLHPRAAIAWLLRKPKRRHLVPESLRSFLQFDENSGKPRPLSESRAERETDDYINVMQGQGKRPTIKGLEAAAKKAGFRGGRKYLRTAFNRRMGRRRGRPKRL